MKKTALQFCALVLLIYAFPPLLHAAPASVAAGAAYSAALSSTGTAYAWGDYKATGMGYLQVSSKPNTLFADAVGVAEIAAGYYHTLARKTDGSVWAWGSNSTRQMGVSVYSIGSETPLPVAGLVGKEVRQLAAGGFHSLALLKDGTALAWGENLDGQQGNGDTQGAIVATPAPLTGLANILALAAGGRHSLALENSGRVWGWGNNSCKQAGISSADAVYKPELIAGLAAIKGLSAGGYHSLALAEDGSVWAWGCNQHGQLGIPGASGAQPAKIPGLEKIRAIAAGEYHSLALAEDGGVWVWGAAWGNGSAGDLAVPTRLTLPKAIAAVAAGMAHSVTLDTDGLVWAWGRNRDGQLGDGTFAQHLAPELVVNEAVNGVLDLIPESANTIPPDKIPPFLTDATKSGALSSTTFSVKVKGKSGNGFSQSGFSGDYSVYVAASQPDGGGGLKWWQLGSTPGHVAPTWGGMTWPIGAFMSNVTLNKPDSEVIVDILSSENLSSLVGAIFYVGYGTSFNEMLSCSPPRYRRVLEIEAPKKSDGTL